MAESRSRILVGTFCLAGVVALLAVNQSTSLYAAPATVSSQTIVAPVVPVASRIVPRAQVDTIQDPEVATVDEIATNDIQGSSWTGMVAGLLAVPLAVASFFMMKKRPVEEERKILINIDDLMNVGKSAAVAGIVAASAVDAASAYPIFAQQGFPEPREATGRIVCANCHLAQKPTEVELPQAVLPDQVFEAVTKIPYSGSPAVSQALTQEQVTGSITFEQGQPVEFVQHSGVPVSQMMVDMDMPSTPNTVFKATIKVPYDKSLKQVGAKGKPVDLNVGAVLILPEGFKMAPPERVPENIKEEMNGLQFIQYSADKPNILVVGPVPGKTYEELVVPILSPDPETNKSVHYGSLPVFVGGNRGRGQLYPTGEKSNNNAYNVEHSGKIADIEFNDKKKQYTIAIQEPNGLITNEELPQGSDILVKKGDVVEAGQAITSNPNVGGFGQTETEIVLQDPFRVKWLLAFTASVLGTQVFLVTKKKQWEQVQAAEMDL